MKSKNIVNHGFKNENNKDTEKKKIVNTLNAV